MNSRNNRSIDTKPNRVKNSDFMSILYSKPLKENIKPNFGIEVRVRISKYDSPFRKENKPQFTKKISEIVAISTRKLQHIQSMTNKKKLYVGIFTGRKGLESFKYGLVYKRVGFQRILAALSKQYAQFIYKFLAREFGRTMGGSIFRVFLPINVPKRYRR